MDCEKCAQKLRKVIAPDPFTRTSEQLKTSRKVNENKHLSDLGRHVIGSSKCEICKKSLHQDGRFCQTCAFQQGKCAMCGLEVQDVSMHNVGGDLERKVVNQRERERREKIMKLERLEEARDAEEEERKVKKTKREQGDDVDDDDQRVKKKSVIAAAAVDDELEARKTTPQRPKVQSGPTSLIASLVEQSSASLNKQTTGWQYDPKSGYYFDVIKQQYYCPNTKLYFCCKTKKWLTPEAQAPKNGTFKAGTRKPDKFGL